MPDQNEPKLIASSRQPDSVWDLFDDPSAQEFYVDGIGGMMIGGAVTKVTMYTTRDLVDENGLSIEKRQVRVRFVMPTTSLAEWFANGLNSFAHARPAIQEQQQRVNAVIENAIAQVKRSDAI